MLKPLYDYALRHQLTPPPGMVKKTVKAWIGMTEDGEFLGIRLDGQEEYFCPDVGSLANGKDKCNMLVEKDSVVFGEDDAPKHRFFVDTLRQAAQEVPQLSACMRVFEDASCREQVLQELKQSKIKPSDRVSFEIDGVPIPEIPDVREWWQGFRQQFIRHGKEESLCLITGQRTMPVATLSPVQGLYQAGGHGKGDALFCFDKPAFCSYGLKKSANAPVSAEAIEAVKAALDYLMSDSALSPVLAGMRFVHWFDCDVPIAQNPVNQVIKGDGSNDEADSTEDEFEEDELEEEEDDESANPDEGRLIPAQRIASIETGKAEAPIPEAAQYYILLLSGVTGRVMIRSYDHGNYHTLEKNVQKWRSDLQMTDLAGTGMVKIHSLRAMLIRLMAMRKHEGKDKVFKRMDKELSGIIPSVLHAILTDSILPDSVAVRALRYIRGQMASASEEDRHAPVPDAMCCQWLRAWLLRRNNREDGVIDAMYNRENTNVAYRCGAWVAIYASIQQFTMVDVNAGIVQRYYASACQMPALVLGQLSMRSVPHQEKIKSKPYKELYQDAFEEVTRGIESIPATLSLEQQAYFALGYRQMTAELNARKKQIKEKNAEAETEEEE